MKEASQQAYTYSAYRGRRDKEWRGKVKNCYTYFSYFFLYIQIGFSSTNAEMWFFLENQLKEVTNSENMFFSHSNYISGYRKTYHFYWLKSTYWYRVAICSKFVKIEKCRSTLHTMWVVNITNLPRSVQSLQHLLDTLRQAQQKSENKHICILYLELSLFFNS